MTEFEQITYGMSIHQLEEELKYQHSLGYSDVDAFPSYIINEINRQKSYQDKLIKYLNELSYIISCWQNNNFDDVSSTLNLLGITEEVGELSHHHLKELQGIRTNEDHRNGKIDSIGDILIFLINYCNKEKINIGEALINTWNEVSKRDWKKYPIKGLTESIDNLLDVEISTEDLKQYLKEVKGIEIGDKIEILQDVILPFPIIFKTGILKSIKDTERVEILFEDNSTMIIDSNCIIKWTEK